MERKPKIMRQGDVLLVQVDQDCDGMETVERESGNIVLAHGEATGHTHAVASKAATLYGRGADRFLRVVKRAVQLRHEEHAPVTIDPGTWRVIRQREYTPAAVRNVAD